MSSFLLSLNGPFSNATLLSSHSLLCVPLVCSVRALHKSCESRAARKSGAKPLRPVQKLSLAVRDTLSGPSTASAVTVDRPSVMPVSSWDRGGRTKETGLTKMYHQIQETMLNHPDCVCLVQVGSFYELYFDQAEEYGPKLSLKVAIRKTTNFHIPMAGFPVSQLQKFVKLLVHDHDANVAIVDQYDTDLGATRGISRRISRIVSPGTLVDETFLNYNKNNYLLAIYLPPHITATPADPSTKIGLAWIDVSVGEFHVEETTLRELTAEMARISPSEIILPKDFQGANLHDGSWYPPLTDFRRYFLRYHKSIGHGHSRRFKGDPQVVRRAIEALEVRQEAAMNMALSYIHVNLPDASPSMELPMQHVSSSVLQLDSRTRSALELTERAGFASGKASTVGSLLSSIRRTATPSGARLLSQWLQSPLLDDVEIGRRHDFVDMFLLNPLLRVSLRSHLTQIGDFVRSLQQLAYNTGDPVAQLLLVADGISKLQVLRDYLASEYITHPQELAPLRSLLRDFTIPDHIPSAINTTLDIQEASPVATEAAATKEEAAFEQEEFTGITSSYSNSSIQKYRASPEPGAELTQTQAFRFVIRSDYDKALEFLHKEYSSLERKEILIMDEIRESFTSIDPALKLMKKDQHFRFQNILYISGKPKLIEAAAVMFKDGLCDQKKQSLVLNPLGWVSLQLQLLTKRQEILDRERVIIEKLKSLVLGHVSEIRNVTRLVDFLDVTLSFSIVAQENNWIRPRFAKTNRLSIVAGRHAVVESGLKACGKQFIPNDTRMSPASPLWVISGPNMGGKSTFLRQNALIVILAQCGSFVPAEKATLGIVDRIFTRIGALDDLFSDLSTFMVEMIETSNILLHATPQSLAIVDEIGRGTSGKEGLAIAYATLVNLIKVKKCRTLFATHFGKELQQLLSRNKVDQSKITYMRTRVLLHENNRGLKSLVIDHTLEPGLSEMSYALEVARLAGFPPQALEIAENAHKMLTE